MTDTPMLALPFAAVLLCAAPAMAASDDVFILSYFRTPAEALHLAYSTDGLTWTALNGNKPVLHANVGNKSIRDPYIRKGPGGWFHLVSTNSWKAKDLIYTKSKDLIHWEPQHLLPVMAGVEHVRNVWAPEFVFDEEKGDYLIFWSSVTEPEGKHQRIWCCRTKNFQNLSAPRVLFDPGYTVIDATLVRSKDMWHMAFKDARGENKKGTDNKAMRMATAASLGGPYQNPSGLVTPHLTEGPAIFRAGDRWLMLYDHFMEHKWGASESRDLVNWTPVTAKLTVPETCRHGSVFTITNKEFDALRAAFGK